MSKLLRTQRIQIMVTPDEYAAMDAFRFENRPREAQPQPRGRIVNGQSVVPDRNPKLMALALMLAHVASQSQTQTTEEAA